VRLLKQLGAVLVVAVPGSIAVQALHAWGHSFVLTLVVGVAIAALMIGMYRWVVRRTEHRSAAEVASAGAGSALARGITIGTLVVTAVIGIIAVLGAYRVDGWGSPAAAAGFLGLTAVVVASEELIFRGIVQRLLEERVGTWIALAVTAALFGAVHLVNPHATLWGAVAVAIEAGGMLGAAYVATRSLWLPMGLHFGWNFVVGGIFGTEVSGNVAEQGLLDGATSGSTLLTGGAFGPEGSIIAVLACTIITVALLRLAHQRGHIVRRRDVRPATTPTSAARATATV
jgi:membrane protease YdiL (CAAX protease family)